MPRLQERPSGIFPNRGHTYPVRCQVHISIVQNVQLASSKAYKLCRERKLTRARGFPSEPLLSSSVTTRPESGWKPCSSCALSSYPNVSVLVHLDWVLCSTPLKHLPLPQALRYLIFRIVRTPLPQTLVPTWKFESSL